MRRALCEVVYKLKGVVASVPQPGWLPRNVGQCMPGAAVHAVLIDPVAGDVGPRDVAEASALRFAQAVLEHAPPQSVVHRQPVAFGVERCPGGVAAVPAVVRDRKTCTPERVEVYGSPSPRMRCGLLPSCTLRRPRGVP